MMQQNQVAFLFCRNRRMQIPVSRKWSAGILRECVRGSNRRLWVSAMSRGVPKVAHCYSKRLFLWTVTPFKLLLTFSPNQWDNDLFKYYIFLSSVFTGTPSDVFVEPNCCGFALCLRCSGPVNGDIVFEVQISFISITKDGERLNIPNFNILFEYCTDGCF